MVLPGLPRPPFPSYIASYVPAYFPRQAIERACCHTHHRWLINVKVIAAILLVAAVPLWAQAQSPSVPRVSKGDAEKVASIISSDKAKTQAYCEINKVSDEMNQVYGKNDKKRLDEARWLGSIN